MIQVSIIHIKLDWQKETRRKEERIFEKWKFSSVVKTQDQKGGCSERQIWDVTEILFVAHNPIFACVRLPCKLSTKRQTSEKAEYRQDVNTLLSLQFLKI